MGRTFQAPQVEYGYALPPKRKKRDLRRTPRPSPWIDFLKDLPIATGLPTHTVPSFLVEYARLQALRNVAAKIGIELEILDTKESSPMGLRLARVWRIS